jgi:hypothetical protein
MHCCILTHTYPSTCLWRSQSRRLSSSCCPGANRGRTWLERKRRTRFAGARTKHHGATRRGVASRREDTTCCEAAPQVSGTESVPGGAACTCSSARTRREDTTCCEAAPQVSGTESVRGGAACTCSLQRSFSERRLQREQQSLRDQQHRQHECQQKSQHRHQRKSPVERASTYMQMHALKARRRWQTWSRQWLL